MGPLGTGNALFRKFTKIRSEGIKQSRGLVVAASQAATLKAWQGVRSQLAYLRRLAVVFAIEIRLKIVTELYMQEMSPTQFFEEFGGTSASRVDRNFKRLVEHGWLTYIRSEGPGGDRRGGTEHFYRARELAIFDNKTWRLLPYSIRRDFSCTAFRQLAERVREAMEAGTFDAREDRHFSWTPLLLDRLGWERVLVAIDALFEFLFEEQADAKLRISQSGEKPFLATVGLSGFESPMRDGERVGPSLVEGEGHFSVPFPVRLSKVFADEICLKILTETNLRDMSAPQFRAEFGGDSVDGTRRRFKVLEENGWLTRVDVKTGGKRRGAKEHFYRATGSAIYDIDTWPDLPDSVKASLSWTTFEQLCEQVKEAMEAGTFDAREDRHMSWSLIRLDQRGWEKAIAAVDALFEYIFQEAEKAETRVAKSGEETILMTVALAVFESPSESAKAP